MNILLVDDQPNIISSLVSCIPWHSLGFSSIFTATSAEAAREILSTHKVDILITDIEMGCDSEEAPEKWEPGLPAAFEGRWGRTTSPSRSYLLRKGQENNTAKQLPAENATLCLHTTHPRAVKLPFPMKMKVEGEAR